MNMDIEDQAGIALDGPAPAPGHGVWDDILGRDPHDQDSRQRTWKRVERAWAAKPDPDKIVVGEVRGYWAKARIEQEIPSIKRFGGGSVVATYQRTLDQISAWYEITTELIDTDDVFPPVVTIHDMDIFTRGMSIDIDLGPMPTPAAHVFQESTQARFDRLAAEWRRDTAMLSSIQRKVMHPAYQRIIGLGPEGIDPILRDLRDVGAYWFWALTAITGEDPAAGTESYAQARTAWLDWGAKAGIL